MSKIVNKSNMALTDGPLNTDDRNAHCPDCRSLIDWNDVEYEKWYGQCDCHERIWSSTPVVFILEMAEAGTAKETL